MISARLRIVSLVGTRFFGAVILGSAQAATGKQLTVFAVRDDGAVHESRG